MKFTFVTPPIGTNEEAKRVVELCEAGQFYDPWKPTAAVPKHYETAIGRIRQDHYILALMRSTPDPE